MQAIATRVFIYSSIVFGIIGILVVITLPAPGPGAGAENSVLNTALLRLLFADVFIILPSFALSVAGKYLGSNS